MTERMAVGKSIPRVDAMEKVTGRALYGADVSLPGMLHGKILRSTLSHARILNIDASRAKRLPGVKAVVTGADCLDIRHGLLIKDRRVFAREKVRYIGEEMGAVAAVDLDTAQEALSLIRVDYAELPPVLDVEEAMRGGAPLVHEELMKYQTSLPVLGEGNIIAQDEVVVGKGEAAFGEADCIVEETYRTQTAHQGYIEPHAALGHVDGQGKVTVWTTTQTIWWTRAEVATVLGLPLTKVRIIPTEVGGGFGGKLGILVGPTAVLAVKAGKPVKMVLSREEEFTCTRPRHPCTIKVRAGFKRDGSIVAMRVDFIMDAGAYADFSPATAGRAASATRGPYHVPNGLFRGYAVYTTKLSSGAYRAPGFPQAIFAVERMMDTAALQLAIDPVELRLKNGLKDGDLTFAGERLKRSSFRDNLKAVAEKISWEKKPAPSTSRALEIRNSKFEISPRRGLGVACGHWNVAGFPCSVNLKINEDGTINLITGAVNLTGTTTSIAQMVADEFGVPMEDVSVVVGDTDTTMYGPPSGGSMITYNIGNAARIAAQDARQQLFEIAAEKLKVDVNDLVAEDRMVYARSSRDKAMSIAQLSQASQTAKGGLILGKGSSAPLPPHLVICAQAAEVEVDPQTGQVRVLKMVAAQDVGYAVNPMSVEGQIQGGVAQGLGFATTEEYIYKDGVLLNPHFMDYKMPTALDVPQIEPVLVENPTGAGPYGLKGVGEPPHVPAAAAIANAVCNAIGANITALPLTPERVLAAIKNRIHDA